MSGSTSPYTDRSYATSPRSPALSPVRSPFVSPVRSPVLTPLLSPVLAAAEPHKIETDTTHHNPQVPDTTKVDPGRDNATKSHPDGDQLTVPIPASTKRSSTAEERHSGEGRQYEDEDMSKINEFIHEIEEIVRSTRASLNVDRELDIRDEERRDDHDSGEMPYAGLRWQGPTDTTNEAHGGHSAVSKVQVAPVHPFAEVHYGGRHPSKKVGQSAFDNIHEGHSSTHKVEGHLAPGEQDDGRHYGHGLVSKVMGTPIYAHPAFEHGESPGGLGLTYGQTVHSGQSKIQPTYVEQAEDKESAVAETNTGNGPQGTISQQVARALENSRSRVSGIKTPVPDGHITQSKLMHPEIELGGSEEGIHSFDEPTEDVMCATAVAPTIDVDHGHADTEKAQGQAEGVRTDGGPIFHGEHGAMPEASGAPRVRFHDPDEAHEAHPGISNVQDQHPDNGQDHVDENSPDHPGLNSATQSTLPLENSQAVSHGGHPDLPMVQPAGLGHAQPEDRPHIVRELQSVGQQEAQAALPDNSHEGRHQNSSTVEIVEIAGAAAPVVPGEGYLHKGHLMLPKVKGHVLEPSPHGEDSAAKVRDAPNATPAKIHHVGHGVLGTVHSYIHSHRSQEDSSHGGSTQEVDNSRARNATTPETTSQASRWRGELCKRLGFQTSHGTQLTQQPARKRRPRHNHNRSEAAAAAGRPSPTHQSSGNSNTSHDTIHTTEQKFGDACDNLHKLMHEALAVAHDAAEYEHDRRREAHIQLPHGCVRYATRRAHQSQLEQAASASSYTSDPECLGTELEVTTGDEERDDALASVRALRRPSTPRGDVPHFHKGLHRCLLPGVHFGGLRLTIPQRVSSLHARTTRDEHSAISASPAPRSRLHKSPKFPMSQLARGGVTTTFDGAASDAGDRRRGMDVSLTRHGPSSHHSPPCPVPRDGLTGEDSPLQRVHDLYRISLHGKSHVSLRGPGAFSLPESRRHQGIARDWSRERKRFVASVACISTAMIGVLIGIYAGLVPSIQYYIADFYHYAVLGNVVFFLALAIPTFCFWPLPLLHGRKPYILSSLVLAMPLLFPQAISVSTMRSPYVSTWRWSLLASRAFMGFVLGFASMNFHAILMDLFGASLMSGNPHQELVDKHDIRRHGGGMGVWLGIWTWCFMGSLGVGFLVGAAIINTQNPAWGFYVSIIIIAVVLLLNVVCPEVRRSSYRRSVTEVRSGTEISRRIARGEVMMHRVKTGPLWWGEEVYHGVLLSLEMLKQPGFAVVAVYLAWTYCQFVLIIVLLGSLTSRYYLLQSTLVGACVAGVAIGALLGVPFQKANIFSRARHHQENLNKMTLDKRITWTSHLLRRLIFTAVLPLVSIAYAIASKGPPTPVAIPTLLAALVGFLSCLAISECNGLIMETFDCSDLQRANATSGGRGKPHRKNYSSFPRVAAGFAISHSMGFVFAAAATGVGGIAERALGQQAATGTVAGILVVLTLLLSAVLVRFKKVQIIPRSKTLDMAQWDQVRRESLRARSVGHAREGEDVMARDAEAALRDAEPYRPTGILGGPTQAVRRCNVLEMGALTRWSEIRRKNKLVDLHVDLNAAAVQAAVDAARLETRAFMERAGTARVRGSKATERSHGSRVLNGEAWRESQCVMHQSVAEEDEEGEVDGGDENVDVEKEGESGIPSVVDSTDEAVLYRRGDSQVAGRS